MQSLKFLFSKLFNVLMMERYANSGKKWTLLLKCYYVYELNVIYISNGAGTFKQLIVKIELNDRLNVPLSFNAQLESPSVGIFFYREGIRTNF